MRKTHIFTIMALGVLSLASCKKAPKVDEIPEHVEPGPAKLCLTVVLTDEFNAIPGTATNPVSSLSVNGLGGGTPIIPEASGYTAGELRKSLAVAEYECRFAPQEAAAGQFGATAEINGTQYVWTSTDAVKFESDFRYSLMLTFAADGTVTASEIFRSEWDKKHEFEIEPVKTGDADVWDGTLADDIPGSGTEEDPFLITKGSELAYLASVIESGVVGKFSYSKHYKLGNDIDLDNRPWKSIGYMKDWSGNSLHGVFDGNGHTIYNLKSDESGTGRTAGLFGSVTSIVIKKLTIYNADIKSDCLSGILAGYITQAGGSTSYSEVIDCHVTGKVAVSSAGDNNNNFGGMFGQACYTKVKDCTAYVDVKGNGCTGGLAGSSYFCDYENCSVRGAAEGIYAVGGFTGALEGECAAKSCVSRTNVTATNWNCGGFVGYFNGYDVGENKIMTCTATDCAAYGTVTSTMDDNRNHAGGFAGYMAYASATNCLSGNNVIVEHRREDSQAGTFIGYDGGNSTTSGCHYSAAKNTGKFMAVGATEEGVTSTHDITAE